MTSSAWEDRGRDSQAERLGGAEIDDQLERRRLLDRQIGRLGALEPQGSRPLQSHRHCGGRGLPPMRAADHSDSPPSGTRSPDFAPRHSRFRSAPDGTPLSTVRSGRAQNCRGSRPPASPSAARGGCAARSSRRPARGLTRGGSLDDPLATGVRLNARPTRDADAPHPSSWRGYLRARRCWFKEFVPPRAAVAARRNDAAGLSWSATGQEWLSGCSPGA
jgi:hypothetical protein